MARRTLVLTLRPAPHLTLSQHIAFARDSFRKLVQRIRRNFGEFEYFCALELTKKGTPHFHILYRGTYISQRWLSQAWCKLTGAFRVHISEIRHRSGAVREVVKYLTKTTRQCSGLPGGLAPYTMSRHWLPPDWNDRDGSPLRDPYAEYFCISWSDLLYSLEELRIPHSPHPHNPRAITFDVRSPPDLLSFFREHPWLPDQLWAPLGWIADTAADCASADVAAAYSTSPSPLEGAYA